MVDTDKASFGALLRRFRRYAGLTQEQLAERAGLSVRGIGNLERDSGHIPYETTVIQLAEALELSPADRAALLDASRRRSPDSLTRSMLLGRPLSSFIGREREMQEIEGFLARAQVRLVTLTGPGGVGKTRLALEAATRFEDRDTGGVAMASLASLADPQRVPSAIARALEIREAAGRSVMDSIIAHLHDRRLLLVLDNLEHLLPAAASLAQMLSACPDLQLLVTSRTRLGLQGEQEYPVGPLPIPAPDNAAAGSALIRYPAVRLFIERATAVRPDFALSDANGPAVAEICRRLDGLPLALELAAARIKVFPPQELLERLKQPLALLTGGAADLPPRQQALRSTIDWSYALLSEQEQALFARLSVFAGGWTFDAAGAVCNPDGDIDVLADLASLVDKSLVQQEETDEARFGMLETIHEYASEQLLQRGERDRLRQAHAEYFDALAEEAGPQLSGPEQVMWLERLDRESDNLRAALRTAARTNDVDLGLRLAGALWPFWLVRGHYREARQWLDAFLPVAESAKVSPVVLARALYAAGTLAGTRGDNPLAVGLLQRALEQARRAGDDRCAADILRMLGSHDDGSGSVDQYARLLKESLALYRRLDDQAGVCAALVGLAGWERFQGNYARAVSQYHEALAIARSFGDSRRVASVLANLGNLEAERGRPARSRPLYDESLTIRRRLGDRLGLADSLLRSAETAVITADFRQALSLCKECLTTFAQLGSDYATAYTLLYQAEATCRVGDLDGAEAIATRCLDSFRQIGDRRCTADALLQLGDIARDRGSHDQAGSLYRESLRIHQQVNVRPSIARCLERLVLLAQIQGHVERAARLHGAATALRCAMGSEMAPADLDEYERCVAAVRDRAGARAFTLLVAEGRDMGLDRAVDYALSAPA